MMSNYSLSINRSVMDALVRYWADIMKLVSFDNDLIFANIM